MLKIACYVHGEWAFGSIHHELVKHLYPYGIDGLVMCWDKDYTFSEFVEYEQTIDLILTTPHGTLGLYEKGFAQPEKCITVFHSQLDILYVMDNFTPEFIKRCKGFGAVSKYLIQRIKNFNLDIDVQYLPLGVNYNKFYHKPSKKLDTIGYAGVYHEREELQEFLKRDLLFILQPLYHKRSFLVKEICTDLNLNFRLAAAYHKSFTTMPGFYPQIDCLICASTEEGAGLPMLEAGAAGRLVLTTPVGHFPEKVSSKGAIEMPLLESDFTTKAKETILYYRENLKHYQEKCEEIQEHAKSYDWKYNIEPWAKFLLDKSK